MNRAVPDSIVKALRPDRALPGMAYKSPDLFAWEREFFWNQSWVLVCRAEEPPPPIPAECTLAEWNGWVWATWGGGSPTPAETFGNLGEQLSAYDLPTLTTVANRAYDVTADWKLLVENYLECYHCASTHPELSRVQRSRGGEDFRSTGNWLGGSLDLKNSSQTMSLDGHGPNWTFPKLDAERARQVCYYAALPSAFITGLRDYVVVHRLTPQGPGRTRVVCSWLFDPELAKQIDTCYAVEFWSTINAQDWLACESVQRGVSNRRYVPGPLCSQESAVGAFLGAISEAYRQSAPLQPTWVGKG